MSLPYRFSSTETGAPVLNNAAGSLIAMLRAVLKDGFNVKGISGITVTSEVATVQCPTHGYQCGTGQVVRITGASDSDLNGDKQPTLIDTNYFSFPAPGVADGSYTATDARRAPLGWTEEFNDGAGTKAIFKRSAPESLDAMLRINDTGGSSIARVIGVLSASGIDSYGSDFFPSTSQVSGGAYWQKGDNNTTPKAWHFVGDDLGFYIATQLGTTSNFVVYAFTDGVPFYAGDTGFTILSAQTNTSAATTPAWQLATSVSAQTAPSGTNGIFSPKGVLPTESTPLTQAMCGVHCSVGLSGYASFQNAGVYLNPVIHPVVYVISAGPCMRGQMPGLAYILASSPFTSGVEVVAGSDAYLPIGVNVSGTVGQLAIKLDGWR